MGHFRIDYSKHAEDQLKERELSKKIVYGVLLNPQQILKTKKGRKIAQSIVKIKEIEFLVRVIYVDRVDCYKVVTVYRTTKIAKYWSE